MKCDCGSECACLVDFSEYLDVLEMVMGQIKESIKAHGDWGDYDASRCFETIADEFDEYREAFLRKQVGGGHGQIDELVDLATVAMKGIVRLRALTPVVDRDAM